MNETRLPWSFNKFWIAIQFYYVGRTFIHTRERTFFDAIRLFESDLPLGCFSLPYLEFVFFEIVSRKELLTDSITEILDQITKTYTISEQLELIRKI